MTTIVSPPPSPPSDLPTATTLAPTTPPTPLPSSAETGAASTWVGVLVSGAVIAAILTAAVNTALARRKTLEEERSRFRATFAEAFEAAMQYKEMPYAIRRRRHDDAGAERVRLSDEMRRIQGRLSYYLIWTAGESPEVGDAYEALVNALRRVVGSACHDAWIAEPAESDEAMNIERAVVDLSELTCYEHEFMAAVRRHLDGFLKIRRITKMPSRLTQKHAVG